MSDPAHTPVHIKAPHGATTTIIDWGDGKRVTYPNTVLRGYCPCAHCQGHGGGISYVPGDSSLRGLEPVGNYALKLAWGDGHDTGIYSFDYLRKLTERDGVTVTNTRPG